MTYALLLFPDFSLIACGWLLCRYTALNRSVWGPLEDLVYYFLFPVLLFYSIVRSPFDFASTSHMLGAGVLTCLCGVGLALSIPHLPLLGKRVEHRDAAASAQVAFRFNSFICLTMAERLAGTQGVQLIAVLIGVCVPIMNVAAVWPMARHSQTGFVQQLLRNPLIIATATGLLANIAGLRIPELLAPALNEISNASTTLGLMSAGAGMQFSSLARSKLLAASVLSIRHLLLPLIAALLARQFGLDATQSTVLLAFSAVPTASSAYVLTARMGYNGPLVAGLVTLSTLLGMLSLPFALGVLR